MVAGNDATTPPEAQRAMAAGLERSPRGAQLARAMISRPHEVTELIVAAANA